MTSNECCQPIHSSKTISVEDTAESQRLSSTLLVQGRASIALRIWELGRTSGRGVGWVSRMKKYALNSYLCWHGLIGSRPVQPFSVVWRINTTAVRRIRPLWQRASEAGNVMTLSEDVVALYTSLLAVWIDQDQRLVSRPCVTELSSCHGGRLVIYLLYC